MRAPRKSLVFPSINDNLVGSAATYLAVATLLAGCGARSDLVDGVPLQPQEMGSSCAPASNAPIAKRFGDDDWQTAASIAVDPHGYPLIAGAFSGSLDLGFTTLSAPTVTPPVDAPYGPILLEGSLFIARLAPPGCSPFALAFSPMDHGADSIHVALTGDGAVLLSASYDGLVDFGGGPVGANDGPASAAVARFSAAGEHLWSHAFHSDRVVLARPAADAQGNVYVAGSFAGTLAFDGVAIGTSSDAGTDGFVAKLDPSGALDWSKVLQLQSASSAALSVVAWPEGDVAVAGRFVANTAVIDLGDGPMTVDHASGFVTSFDTSGQHRWQSLISPFVTDAQLAPSGDLVVLGTRELGAYPIQHFDVTGATSGPTSVDGPLPLAALSLAIGANDEALIAGTLKSPGAGPFALAVDTSGEVLWTRTFDMVDENDSYRVAAAFGPASTPILAGGFTGTMDLGTGTISANAEGSDVFVAALAP